jgi:threonine/homoserine/homoserine lactone efflux protein
MPFDLWLGFLLAALVISVTPGPGAVTSMSAGLQYGYWVALRAILGLQAALLIQLMVVAGRARRVAGDFGASSSIWSRSRVRPI